MRKRQLYTIYDILDLEDCPTPKLQRCQEIHATSTWQAMNIGICPDECKLFYQVRATFFNPPYLSAACLELVPHVLHKMEGGTNILRICVEVPQLNMPHKTLRLRCNISLHKMCYPSRSPTNCPQYFELIFWISEVPKLVVYLIIFDLGFLTKISQIYTQISCLPGCITTEAAFGAGNHKHGTPPVRPVISKNTALNGWFWKKWNYKYVETSDHPLLQVNLMQNNLKYFTRIRGWFYMTKNPNSLSTFPRAWGNHRVPWYRTKIPRKGGLIVRCSWRLTVSQCGKHTWKCRVNHNTLAMCKVGIV